MGGNQQHPCNVLEGVVKSCVMSKIDLTKGYYQIPMHPDDVHKTAFICHQGKFEFMCMPFGVRNAPAIFQELMQRLFWNCKGLCSPYMDDLIIYSDSWKQQREVLECLRGTGLMANLRAKGSS